MKKITLLAVMLTFGCSPAFAETVQDHFKTITKRTPYTETVCNIVDVPIYGSTSSNTTTQDIIGGALIGGIIGHQLGKGDQRKDNRNAGAILGGIIGANKNQNQQGIVGYRQEEQCRNITRYNESSEDIYSHSTVSFYHDGRQYVLRFKK